VRGEEERSLREEVAVGLVLQLAEGDRVPQVQRPAQEGGRIGGQVELGVERRPPGLLQDGAEQQEDPDPGVAPSAPPGSLGRAFDVTRQECADLLPPRPAAPLR